MSSASLKLLSVTFNLVGLIVVPTAYPISLARLVRWIDHQHGQSAVTAIAPVPSDDADVDIGMRLTLWAPPTPLHLMRRVTPHTVVSMHEEGLLTLTKHKFDDSRGMYKTSYRKIYVAPGVSATAQCVAKKDALKRTLAHVTQIGALRSLGYGRVESIEVVQVER